MSQLALRGNLVTDFLGAYIEAVEEAGLANRVARLKPHLVVKG